MPKKIRFESFKYRVLIAAQDEDYRNNGDDQLAWREFVQGLDFEYSKGEVRIQWEHPSAGTLTLRLDEPRFCLRGDSEKEVARQSQDGLIGKEDPVKLENDAYFKGVVQRVAESAGYTGRADAKGRHEERNRLERAFHDAWAESENVEVIDVMASNEVCTAPEMRFIARRLGNIKGKRLLDVGCGLGEASVYFAMLGAEVTSTDLSQGMLDATSRLARSNGVSVRQHLASADDMQLSQHEQFDIIYAGNLLHHVNVEEAIERAKPHLAEGGLFVSWDPLAYNPAINVYRSMATEVRTPDEHPLKWGDIKTFHRHFQSVETRYFWLTTLLIFAIMALVQRRNPNQERFWKVVVQEGGKWRWLYSPLEKLDSILLWLIPPLRLLCWNVVLVASQPIKTGK